jgi:hypothetical protein
MAIFWEIILDNVFIFHRTPALRFGRAGISLAKTAPHGIPSFGGMHDDLGIGASRGAMHEMQPAKISSCGMRTIRQAQRPFDAPKFAANRDILGRPTEAPLSADGLCNRYHLISLTTILGCPAAAVATAKKHRFSGLSEANSPLASGSTLTFIPAHFSENLQSPRNSA